MRSTTSIIISLLLMGVINAQSVESFIQMAHDNNPGLQSLHLNHQAAQQVSGQKGDFPDPKISVGIGVLPIETRLGAQRFKVGIAQPIPWKGLLEARKGVADAMADALMYDADIMEVDMEYVIRSAYAQLSWINDLANVLGSKIEILDIMEDLAKSAVRSGKGKLSNVLLIERNREQLLSDLTLLAQQREQPTITINRWSGRGLLDSIILSDSSEDIDLLLLQLNHQAHPMLSKITAMQASADRRIALTEYEQKPKIGVSLDYAFIDSRQNVDISGNGRDVFMPMASISLPLHTDRYVAKRQEERLRKESLSAKAQDTKDRYQADIAMAISRLEHSRLDRERLEKLKEITSETIELMQTEYATEGTRFEELVRLEMELILYDKQIVGAHYNANLAKASLLKYRWKN